MSSSDMRIYGAGMSGCLAGLMNPSATILEKSPKDQMRVHEALLRFRSDHIGKITGIEFEKVKVRKSIYYEGQHIHECNALLGNMYSKKVTDELKSRSIWMLDAVNRWVAPEDFHRRLLEMNESRILYDFDVTTHKRSTTDPSPVISTIPLPIILKAYGMSTEGVEFKQKKICVTKYRVPNCELHQTIYYPSTKTYAYRASIVGDVLIIESLLNPLAEDRIALGHNDVVDVCNSFGVGRHELELISSTSQVGKIVPLDKSHRKQWLVELTEKHNIYSLGRFALWANILMDDVYDDIFVINKMMNGSAYDRKLIAMEMK